MSQIPKTIFDRLSFLGLDSQGPNKYWLTRFVFLRFLGGMYLVAFLILVNQGLPLIGEDGLLPAKNYLDFKAAKYETTFDAFVKIPTIFWFYLSDNMLLACAWAGTIISFLALIGYANALSLFLLWVLYLSFVKIGQTWYGFGWEAQLLETGFLGIFLCPLLDPRPFPRSPPPAIVFWLLRWLVFRIFFGAGMIKIRGDQCWRDGTCMVFHYETQPIPNPISRWLHFMPSWFHELEVLWNHFTELLVPFFVFGPRVARHIAGLLLIFFQVLLILGGNLSFLNWLTITATIACFDDSFFRHILPRFIVKKAERAEENSKPDYWPVQMSFAMAALVLILSLPVVKNIFSPHQIMNTSFDRYFLVNTYGAFGSVSKVRHELIIKGTSDLSINQATLWESYEFKAKPGDPKRTSPFISPYHYRLDWQIWFAAMSLPQRQPWAYHLIWKLLHNDAGALSLLGNNPFPKDPPKFIKIDMYRYEFQDPGENTQIIWKRELIKPWLGPFSKETEGLKDLIEKKKWKP